MTLMTIGQGRPSNCIFVSIEASNIRDIAISGNKGS